MDTETEIVETRSYPTHQAYRLAAIFILLNMALTVSVVFYYGLSLSSLLSTPITVLMAVFLWRDNRGARAFLLLGAVIGLLYPIFMLIVTLRAPSSTQSLELVLLSNMAQWSISIALITVLTGQSEYWRLGFAAVIFGLGLAISLLRLLS